MIQNSVSDETLQGWGKQDVAAWVHEHKPTMKETLTLIQRWCAIHGEKMELGVDPKVDKTKMGVEITFTVEKFQGSSQDVREGKLKPFETKVVKDRITF